MLNRERYCWTEKWWFTLKNACQQNAFHSHPKERCCRIYCFVVFFILFYSPKMDSKWRLVRCQKYYILYAMAADGIVNDKLARGSFRYSTNMRSGLRMRGMVLLTLIKVLKTKNRIYGLQFTLINKLPIDSSLL